MAFFVDDTADRSAVNSEEGGVETSRYVIESVNERIQRCESFTVEGVVQQCEARSKSVASQHSIKEVRKTY